MHDYRDGAVLGPVEKGYDGSVAGLAQRFFVYGAYSEIFARETGFNRGLGGSMHAFFAPFGIYPNNAIVGGSGSIAPGAALYKRANRQAGIVVANIGDASFGCGPVWEGITFASMDQYRNLWDQALGGGLPIIFNCMDNFYGMGGQPNGETMSQQLIARVGAGVNPEQMHTERVNGYNPLAVIDAFERKKQILAEGRGPVLLDTITYRFSGHSPSDASSYRSAEEVQHWQAADALQAYRQRLIDGDVAGAEVLDEVQHAAAELVFEMFKLASGTEVSPRLEVSSELVGSVMFSGRRVERFDERPPSCCRTRPTTPGCNKSGARCAPLPRTASPCPR